MGKIRTWFMRFMYGRYGADALYNALFLLEIIILVLAAVFQFIGAISSVFAVLAAICYALSLLLIVFMTFRMMSRRIDKRRRENMWYLKQKAKFKGLFKSKKRRVSAMDTELHIFRACPHCSATLRLPRRGGKHTVRCPRCSKTFNIKVRGKK